MLKDNPDKEQSLEELTAVLKALTDPNRLRVFKALMRGASCNRWLAEELDLPANLLSHHGDFCITPNQVQSRIQESEPGREIVSFR